MGRRKLAPDRPSLAQFIEQLGMKRDRVAVELNREIVPRDAMGRNAVTRR